MISYIKYLYAEFRKFLLVHSYRHFKERENWMKLAHNATKDDGCCVTTIPMSHLEKIDEDNGTFYGQIKKSEDYKIALASGRAYITVRILPHAN